MKAPPNNNAKAGKNESRGSFFTPEMQLLLFAILLTLIFFPLFHYIYKIQYSGTPLYLDFASRVLHGSLPYRDFSLEYPPFALLFFLLPRFFTSTYITYAIYYRIEVFISILIGLYVLYLVAQRLGKSPWKIMLIYIVAILAIGPIIAEQYDVFPAVLTLLALYFFWVGRHKTSWVLLALGALTKIYPLFLAPILLLYHLRNHEYRRLWSGVIAFAVTCLIVFLPFLILSPGSILYLVNYHSQRGIQLESVYSSFLLIGDKLGLTPVKLVMNFGSWNLSSPLANVLAKISLPLMGLILLIAYWFIYSQMKPGKSQFTRLGAYALLVTGVALISGKILSPQYLIWLIPLMPLIFGQLRHGILAIFVVIGALTYTIFPVNYYGLLYLQTGMAIILFFRDILLILLTVMAAVSLRQMKASD